MAVHLFKILNSYYKIIKTKLGIFDQSNIGHITDSFNNKSADVNKYNFIHSEITKKVYHHLKMVRQQRGILQSLKEVGMKNYPLPYQLEGS